MKYNKEERKAIVAKIEKEINKRNDEIWKTARDNYKPSKEYKLFKDALENREKYCKIILEINSGLWSCGEINIQYQLDCLRDRELEKTIKLYHFNASDLESEIILNGRSCEISELIQKLVDDCFNNN